MLLIETGCAVHKPEELHNSADLVQVTDLFLKSAQAVDHAQPGGFLGSGDIYLRAHLAGYAAVRAKSAPAPETKTRFPARAAPAYLPNDRLAGSDISSSRSRSATSPIGCLFALLRPRSSLSRLSRGISLLGFVTVFSRGDCCAGRQAIRRVVLALHVNHGNGGDAVPLA